MKGIVGFASLGENQRKTSSSDVVKLKVTLKILLKMVTVDGSGRTPFITYVYFAALHL